MEPCKIILYLCIEILIEMAKNIIYNLTPNGLKKRQESLKNLDLKSPKGIYSAPQSEIEKLPSNEVFEYLKFSNSWGIFTQFKDELENERKFLIREVNKITDVSTTKIKSSQFDIYDVITKLQIRICRFLDSINPTYDFTINTTNLYLKKEDKTIQIPYEVSRIYYMNDEGYTERTIKRVFGRKDYSDSEEVVKKLIMKNIEVDDVEINNSKFSNRYMPDLIVTINGAKWVVEIKRNKSDFMGTAVSLELWSKYKSTYFV